MVVIRKMKEKCKDAARMRREKERVEFVELSKLLPLPSSTTSQLDKASIIRLTSSYLRMRSAFPQGLGENWGTKRRLAHRRNPTGSSPPTGHEELAFRHSLNASVAQQGALAHNATFQSTNQIKELGSLLLQTLDGFVFALHRDGKIMYVSETASVHLGLPQIDLTGSSVFDYIHPADHNDIMDMLNLTELERSELADKEQNHKQEEAEGEEEDRDTIEIGRSFCMRMKCVLPKRNAGLVSNGYKAIHCSGYLKIRCKGAAQASSFSSAPSPLIKRSKLGEGPFAQNSWESYALVAVGHSLLPTASTEIKLGQRTFMFRANLDLRLHHIESQASNLLGFQQTDLIGHSLYQIVHAADLSHLEQAHKQVLDKGQAVSRYHRLMRQDGGYIWVQTHATLVSNPRNIPRPQHVVGICCVIGENLNDDSRALLVDEPPGRPESSSMAAFVAKQSIEKSTVPMKKLKTSQNKSLIKLAPAKNISKRNRNQKQTQPGGQNVDEIKSLGYHQYLAEQQTAQCNYTPETIGENCPSRIYQAIGPARRPSDDSCSVVSSVASTMSASSTSGYSYSNYNKPTTNSLTSSPPSHKMTMMEPNYNYKCASSCAQNQQHFFTSTQSSLSSPVHSDQYSSRIHIPSRNYETQDYWSMQEVHCDQSSLPISIDTSCGQHHSSSLPTKATSSSSPHLTISTLAASQVSSDCSLGNVVGASGGYAISPEHPYAGNQYYYRLDSRGYDYIHDDGVLQAYPNETQVYLDYTKIDGRRASISCNAQQSGSYYYTSHYGIAYASENTSA